MSEALLPDIPITSIDSNEELYNATRDLRNRMEEILQGIINPSGVVRTGKILQVQQVHVTDTSTQVISADVIAPITGMELIITPTTINSKFLVMCRWGGEFGTDAQDQVFGLLRNDIPVGLQSNTGSRHTGLTVPSISYHAGDNDSTLEAASFNYVDTPNTVTPVAYKMYYLGRALTLYNNRSVGDLDTVSYERVTSSIIIMEIGE